MTSRGLTVFLLFMILLGLSNASVAQGLKFKGNDFLITERTSYSVFTTPPAAFTGCLSIGFDLALPDKTYSGYILRIKDEQQQKIYSLSFGREEETVVFKINEEGKSNLITAYLPANKFYKKKWQQIEIKFDFVTDSLSFTVNDDQFQASNLQLTEKWVPKIYFGCSDHIIDLPSFAIKDLLIKDAKEKYFFPLREKSGTVVHNSAGKETGTVANPIWLINNSFYWSYKTSFQSPTVACANFNHRTHEVYFLRADSMSVYNIQTGVTSVREYADPCPVSFILGTNYIDYTNNRLYAYDAYKSKSPQGQVACLDLETYTWHLQTPPVFTRQIHHHGGYLDEAQGRYTLFGGFGHKQYSKDFYTYDPGKGNWEKEEFEGDVIFPRYFLSMGHAPKTDLVYIFGGMGNESGDQYVGRRYYYDLYEVNMKTHHIRKLWEIPWEHENVVPVRGMVLTNDSTFYTLCYSEHFSNSMLRLYQFAIKDGSYKILGDSIPIRSEKIKTNANLYYDEALGELCAIVQEFDNADKASEVKVYTLSFPPITQEELLAVEDFGKHQLLWILVFASILPLSVIAWLIYKKRKGSAKKQLPKPELSEQENVLPIEPKEFEPVATLVPPILSEQPQKNAIYLFGEFVVKDKGGKDISYMFGAKQRQLFLLILRTSTQDGISSLQLGELVWPDKPEDKVKNSRGVALNHLRKLLSELDGVQLIYEKGVFRIIFTEECYCDYIRYLSILAEKSVDINRDELIRILTRGKFLKFMDSSLFDSFKEKVENSMETVLIIEIHSSYASQQYSNTLQLTETLFGIDPFNDTAIEYTIRAILKLKTPEDARKRYLFFALEYKKCMGEEYPISFAKLSN